jgi:uncharacterized membrane protein YkoI
MISMQKKLPYTARFYLLPAIFFVAIVGANAYIFLQNPLGAGDPPQFSDSQKQPEPLILSSSLLTVEKVRSLALSEKPQAAITKIELENINEKPVYIISFDNDTQLAFDAQTGAKLSGAIATDSPEKEVLPSNLATTISFDQAKEIALAQNPGGIISKIELVSEGDKVTYRVLFADGSSIHIAAADGVIVRREEKAPGQKPGSNTMGNPAPETNSTDAIPGLGTTEYQNGELDAAPEPTDSSETN